MNPKAVGELSEAIVLAALIEAGYAVSIPFGNNQRYDLILDDGTNLERIQVKTGFKYNGCITFSSCSRNSITGERRPYEGEIDGFMVYFPGNRKIYRIPVEDCGIAQVTLRLDAPHGGSKSKIRWAQDYEFKLHVDADDHSDAE